MKPLIIIISSLVLCSCKTTFPRLYGRCINGYGCEQILLKPNQEFESYKDFHMMGKRTYIGKWEKKNDTIILNTFLQPRDALVKVDEIRTPQPGITIKLKNAFYPFVKVGTDTNLIRPHKNEVILRDRPDSITFIITNTYDLKPYPIGYSIHDKEANLFEASFQEVDTYKVLTNEKYIYKRRKLLLIGYKGPLHKTKLGNKKW